MHSFCNDYKELDLSHLIDKCLYNKGSLKHVSLKAALNDASCVVPLPPVHEAALTPEQRRSIFDTIRHVYPNAGEKVEILTLYQKCSAVHVGEFLLGSTSGRRKSAAVVFVKGTDRPRLANIHMFLKCSYV